MIIKSKIIDSSFLDYDKRRGKNGKKALLLLKRRAKCLTSNTLKKMKTIDVKRFRF